MKPEVGLYNQEGKVIGELELNPMIFAVKAKPQLVAQAVRVRLARARLGQSSTLTRGEVRGGGRKPWRQKGTGRARHGSIRSPIWVGGGVAHGPKPRKYLLKMPKKMRRQALFSALSQKLKIDDLVVVDKLELKGIKTRDLKTILDNLPLKQKVLVVIPNKDPKIELSIRNLPNKKALEARFLNPYDILNCQTLLLLQRSLAVLEETFLVSEERKPQVFVKGKGKDVNLEDLGFFPRTLTALKKAEITSLSQLRKLSEKEIRDIKGIGEKALGEIKEVLEKNQHRNT